MSIYLTNAFNQFKQFVVDFPKDSLSVILVDAAFLISGWNATARIVDHISKNHPFVKKIKTPISAFGALSIVLLSRTSPKLAAGTVAVLATIAFASKKVKTTYLPEEFKNLLLQKHPFPPNITVEGNLNLSNCPGLTSLPEGLNVKGNLNLSACTQLTSLPERLNVGDTLDLSSCPGLTSLPEGLNVKGNLNLSACTQLTSLPERLNVGGTLDLSYCTGLASLPEGLNVVGHLNLFNCAGLTSLPKGLTVGGTLDLSYCTGLASLPEGLNVKGNLNPFRCTGLTSLPEGLNVKGNLKLFDCPGLTSLPEGLTVGGTLDLSYCTGLTSLPGGLNVGGTLNLSYCTGLTSLPEGLTVGDTLDLSSCTGLTSLPEGLNVVGNLNLSNCIELTSLPEGLTVGGDLNLSNCIELTSLPEGLTVGGDLNLSNCIELTSLPEGLTVKGNLNLFRCTGLTSLPEGLTVGGDLNLSNCIELTSLPKGLNVVGHLNLFRCTGLTSLPEGLTVGGNLNLSNCAGLTSLPEGLNVGGNLKLFDCARLTSLPEGLNVGGFLDLYRCTELTSLPEGLTVGGNLDLTDCTQLTTLPNWIITLGSRTDGRTREIYLDGIGLSEALLNRLCETPAPGIQFHFSNAASVPTQTFPNLDTALTFWVKATNDTTFINPSITILEVALSNVLDFLSRLTETAEYKNPQARPVLAKRVIEAFSLMAKDESIKSRALDLIDQGLTSCHDRIISALGDIELMVLLHQIENKPHTEDKLRALGKRFLFLEMVNEKAKAHKNTLAWVDEIEIYLAFQIGLAERFGLPVKTRNMIFRGCAQITDEQINQAGDAVVRECTEEKLNKFLERWSPWIEHQRKNSPVPAYEDLFIVNRKLESDEICSITRDIPKNPVLYGGTVYDYDAFIECYRATGKDPVNRSEIDLKNLERISHRVEENR